jgi:hypothetical protein
MSLMEGSMVDVRWHEAQRALKRLLDITYRGDRKPEARSEAEAPKRAGHGKSPEAVPETSGRKDSS